MTTDDGRVSLDFPQGAVDDNVTVTIQPIACSNSIKGFRLGNTCFSITAEAGDDMVDELQKSVRICVDYTSNDVAAAGGTPQQLRLAFYDTTAGEWVALATTLDAESGTVCADVSHLSEWAVIALSPGSLPPLWVLITASALLIGSILVFLLVLQRARVKRARAPIKDISETNIDWEEIE